MALWIRIFFFPISKFLSFCRRRNGKKKGSFLYFFCILFVLREGVREWEKNEKPFFFSSFFFLFVSFLPFFLLFLSFFFFGKWEWGGWRKIRERFFLLLFPFEFLFMEKRERINWKKLKEVLSIFRSFFLSFFFPLILLPFSFWEGEWRGKRIEKFAFWRIKEICKNKTRVKKALYIKVFRNSRRIFDTVLIPMELFSS